MFSRSLLNQPARFLTDSKKIHEMGEAGLVAIRKLRWINSVNDLWTGTSISR